jgi:hypothetical protein
VEIRLFERGGMHIHAHKVAPLESKSGLGYSKLKMQVTTKHLSKSGVFRATQFEFGHALWQEGSSHQT